MNSPHRLAFFPFPFDLFAYPFLMASLHSCFVCSINRLHYAFVYFNCFHFPYSVERISFAHVLLLFRCVFMLLRRHFCQPVLLILYFTLSPRLRSSGVIYLRLCALLFELSLGYVPRVCLSTRLRPRDNFILRLRSSSVFIYEVTSS